VSLRYFKSISVITLVVFTIILSTVSLSMLAVLKTKKGHSMALDPNKTLYLIDGSGFLYRAYYGLRPLHTAQGVPVQAVYSFCRMIKKLADSLNPHYMALVWDSKGETVRHTLYPAYKATRSAPPSDLFEQKKMIQQFADLITLKQFEQSGVEADDILYSLAQDFAQEGYSIVLITSDKDMEQTLSDNISIFDPFKDVVIDKKYFIERRGFPVEKLPFYFSLVGDASDNIPGVKGIGAKTALQLVQQFTSLTDLYEHLDMVAKESVRRQLQENKNDAFLSEQLFLLRYMPFNATKDQLLFDKKNWVKAQPLFEELNFKSLLKDLQKEGIELTKKVKLSELKGYIFKFITDLKELEQLIEHAQKAKIIAIDTELDGLNPLENQVIGISCAYKKGEAYYIPFGHTTGENQLSRDQVLRAFQPILRDPDVKKIMHSGNFDERALMHYNCSINALDFDTLIAAHLVTQDWQRISLKAISEFYLNEPMLSFADVVTAHGYKNFSHVPFDLATEYAASDAHQTLQLFPILVDELKKQNMEKLYYDIELPLVEILVAMELDGIRVDRDLLKQLDAYVVADLERLKQEIIDLSGCQKDINLNSPKQIEQLLFMHLKLEPQKKSSKKTGYSTDVEVLQELAKTHPVPALLLHYRELFKLKSTYIDALPEYINKETGKIHTTFSQTAVATGRLASSDPNLQNVPTDTRYHIHIRSAFKPEPGHVFLSADYSQIELRVLAHLSQDDALINAFLNDQDIHAQTASKLFDVALDQVTTEQRQVGKRINFSILYGLTPYGLSKDLGIPFKQAQLYIEKYFAQYPRVSLWMEDVINETKEHGFVTTLWGRRRYVPGIYEKNKMLYDLGRRIAINTKAQGTAAEIMKQGMIQVNKAFKEHNLQAKMVLQIHDELLISVAVEQKEVTEKVVKKVLESVVSWNIPLKVTTRFGNNWQEVTK
jgi:DNA polymerase I